MTIALFILAWLACGVACAVWSYTLAIKKEAGHELAQKLANSMLAFGMISVLIIVCVVLETYFQENWLWPWSAKAKREAGL